MMPSKWRREATRTTAVMAVSPQILLTQLASICERTRKHKLVGNLQSWRGGEPILEATSLTPTSGRRPITLRYTWIGGIHIDWSVWIMGGRIHVNVELGIRPIAKRPTSSRIPISPLGRCLGTP